MAKQTTLGKGAVAIIHTAVSSDQSFDSLIVTFIFIIFVGFLFWELFKSIYKSKNFSWLPIIIFTALIGSAVNSLGDNELNINQLYVFFIFAGSLYGYLLHNSEHKVRYMKSWVSYVLAVLVILSAIGAIQFLRADLARERGDNLYSILGDSTKAIESYFESITYDSRDHLTWYSLWRVYYMNKQYDLAKNSIKRALELLPENKEYVGALKKTEEKLGYPQ
jgi:tetratricopeptide (TPR) repeat protein